MPKRSFLGLSMLALLSIASCGHLRYRSSLPPSGRVYEQRHNFFLAGLIGDATIHLPSVCPQGVHTLDVYHGLGNLFLSALTLGIYTPTTTRVHCAAAGTPGSAGHMDQSSLADQGAGQALQAPAPLQERK
jgi:hypothetical protein